MMRGTIGVESKPGIGSTFWFELPFEKQAAGATPETIPDFQNLRVLVVDDNAAQRAVLQHQLERWRLRSGAAADAPEALRQLRAAAESQDPFAIALIDMHLPGMNGLTLATAIKNEPALAGTRTVMLAPFGQRLDHELMEESGVSQCVLKPAKRSRLLDALMTSTHTETLFAPDSPARGAARAPRPQPAVPLKILLAEDNAVNQKLALRQLLKLGYSAQAVGNGAEVLQELEREPYDVILMDCQMPELDGYEVTRRIRDQEKRSAGQRPSVYIIAITAHAMDGDREHCLSAGMNDYLTKPLHIAHLEAALARAVRRRPAAPEAPAPALDPVSFASLKELREPGQPDPLAELAELYQRESAACVRRLEQGMAEKNSALATRAAHSLKGSSSNLGAHRLAGFCATLEQAAKNSEWDALPAPFAEAKAELDRVRAALAAEVLAG